MKKTLSILVVGLFVLSFFGAVATPELNIENSSIKNETVTLSEPTIIDQKEFVTIEMEEATQLMESGKPMIPVYAETFMFPAGTIIEETTVNIDYDTIQLDSKIQPAPVPVALSTEEVMFEEGLYKEFDGTVYSSSEFYPSETHEVRYLMGINEGEQVIYVNVRCYAQYSPADDFIKIPNSIEYTIRYTEPEKPLISQSTYDLLIITNEKFEDEMLRLKAHKENIGTRTRVVIADTIIESEPELVIGNKKWTAVSGEDWEKVKLYIANERLSNGVQYVLFAGGRKGQTDEYWIPAFHSQNFDGAVDADGVPYDPTYTSDLYFADLFETDQYGFFLFSTWDPNKDGQYAVGPYYPNYDQYIDFVPDIYFGRIPLRYSWEAEFVVDKIIQYETMPAEPQWFKRAVLLGGDTSPYERYPDYATPGIYEGEIICDVTAGYMQNVGWETYKMYMSEEGDHQLNDGQEGSASDEIAEELKTRGAGWLQAQSHANPAVMGNHPMDCICFIYYFTIMDMHMFTSNGKYPFMVLDGCTNAHWDATMQYLFDAGGMDFPGSGGLKWVPTDITSWMVLRENGGALGAIGNTALGYGYLNEYCIQGLGGWVSPRFAHAYAIQGRETTGKIWAQGITDYINNFPVWTDEVQRKTIEERGYFGDPSVKLGGGGVALETEENIEENDDNELEYIPASTVDTPIWNVGDSWTYNLNNIDFNMHEVEGRGIDLKLSTGTLKLEVVEVLANTYVTSIRGDDVNVAFELYFDSYSDEAEDIAIPPINIEDLKLTGKIYWEKGTLSIERIELSMNIDIMDNLEGVPIDLPRIVHFLSRYISIPADVEITIDFDNPYPLFQFPLVEGNEWSIPEGVATINIGGSVQSIWLRLLNFINRFIPLLPPELAKHLPNIDIAALLEDFGIPSVMEIEIPEITEIMRKAPFEVSGQEMVNVPAGTYSATRILIMGGVGNMYYSDQVNNFVRIYSPASEFLPPITNINLELIN